MQDSSGADKVHHHSERYSVYIYHQSSAQHYDVVRWERKVTTSNLRRAKLKARSLWRSNRYAKIELQEHVFDQDNTPHSSVIKVYRTGLSLAQRLQQMCLYLGGLIACLGAIAVFYALL